MNITLRKADSRGLTDIGWLRDKHTFSFGHFDDPDFTGFGSLRVLNEAEVDAGKGFDMHPHENMEIITYVLNGTLEHKDSMGNGTIIRRGDVQRMSAGTGILHSEYNHSTNEKARLLQIWIVPDKQNLSPTYAQKHFSDAEKQGKFKLIASKTGREGSIDLHQDIDMFAGLLTENQHVSYTLRPNRKAWVQLPQGTITLNGKSLQQGDGAAISSPGTLEFSNAHNAEIILFDMEPVEISF